MNLEIEMHKWTHGQNEDQNNDNKNGKANMGSRVLWPWIKVKVIMSYVPGKVLPNATIWYKFQDSTLISVWEIGKSPFSYKVKAIMSYVPVKVLPLATMWYRFQGSTVISDWKISKSLFSRFWL